MHQSLKRGTFLAFVNILLVLFTFLVVFTFGENAYPNKSKGDSCADNYECGAPTKKGVLEINLICERATNTCQCYTLDPENLGPDQGHWNYTWVPDKKACLPDVGAPCLSADHIVSELCASGICSEHHKCAHSNSYPLLSTNLIVLTFPPIPYFLIIVAN